MKRERQKKQTRLLLQQTALQLFQKQGYDETTVLQITNEAGVAKGTFFNYFRTKEDVLQSVFFSSVERVYEKMKNNEHEHWRERMERLFYELTMMHEQLGRKVTKSVLHIYTSKQTFPFTPLLHMLVHLFEEGKRCGDIRTRHSSSSLALMAVQLYVGALQLWIFSHITEPLPTFLHETLHVFLSYIQKEGD
ncbi:TetR/AcrR family transcriptional regulator [Anoxybacillus suryakundensis]|uniref:Transcriptional regulator, TetR family n=1 Tax=Anoxybacillus suryakundensis TaxID=1325335 RepID=A0A0K6GKH7_9BACL|nr:TetR/AcrR family transcriptional regulator [Anoxybacillus suryakundensis]CUA79021.1 transcriptional regulator, TetR family [Anoxybacillus suryakundensis]